MLGSAQITAFVPTTDGERARRFYLDVLGLGFVSDDPFALVLDANGIKVRVSKVGEFTPQKFTVLGWEVLDIEKAVTDLAEKGVSCARAEAYDHFPAKKMYPPRRNVGTTRRYRRR